jgi:hypothetical protein
LCREPPLTATVDRLNRYEKQMVGRINRFKRARRVKCLRPRSCLSASVWFGHNACRQPILIPFTKIPDLRQLSHYPNNHGAYYCVLDDRVDKIAKNLEINLPASTTLKSLRASSKKITVCSEICMIYPYLVVAKLRLSAKKNRLINRRIVVSCAATDLKKANSLTG